MGKTKIDLVKLDELFRSGKSPKELATFFQVSEVAVWKARKKLSAAVVKNVTLESAHRVVDKNVDAIAQLQKINKTANIILDSLMTKIRGDETKGPSENPKEGKEQRGKDIREIALKAMGEIRNQLGLQVEIFKTLYDLKTVAEFQRFVLEAIGEAAPDVQRKIANRLKEARALRGSVELH